MHVIDDIMGPSITTEYNQATTHIYIQLCFTIKMIFDSKHGFQVLFVLLEKAPNDREKKKYGKSNGSRWKGKKTLTGNTFGLRY